MLASYPCHTHCNSIKKRYWLLLILAFSIGLVGEKEETKEYEKSWERVPVCRFSGASHKLMKVCKGCNAVVYFDRYG